MSTSSGGKRLGSKGFLGEEPTASSGSSQALHPELAAAGIQGEEGGIGGGEDGGGGGRGEARGAGEESARGGWDGGSAGRRELSGRLRRAGGLEARTAAPARSELPEPGCFSIRSCKLRARSQQGDGPASVLSGRWDSRCLGLPPLDSLLLLPWVCVCVSALVLGGEASCKGTPSSLLVSPSLQPVLADACLPGAPPSSHPVSDTASYPWLCLLPRCSRCQPYCVCVQRLGAARL